MGLPNDYYTTPLPSSAATTVDGNTSLDMSVEATTQHSGGISSKRPSVIFEGGFVPDDSRKKMRVGEESVSQCQNVIGTNTSLDPLNPATSQVPAQADNGGDDEDDEEDVPVGPDGLRLISDCLLQLFKTNGNERICHLCV